MPAAARLARLAGLAALVLVAGCDAGAPSASASADAKTASTTVPVVDGALDIEYLFHPIDAKAEWDGSFTVTSLDADGKPIVTFAQQETGGSAVPRYAVDFDWDQTIAPSATVQYLAITDGQAQVRGVTEQATGGDNDRPARSYHTMPNGVTRIDYPREGDPFSTVAQHVKTPDQKDLYGVTDIELSFPEGAKVPTPVAVRFTYPADVVFDYWAAD